MIDPIDLVVAGLLLLAGGVGVRGAQDSYKVLVLAVLGSVSVAALASVLLVAYSFASLIGVLSVPLALGVVLGSWPDARTRWVGDFTTDLRSCRDGWPEDVAILVGVAAGLAVGVWAWAALAASLGIVGVLVGSCVFVIVVLAGSFAGLLGLDAVQNRRGPRRGPGT